MVQRIKSGMIDNSLDFTNKTITSPSFSGNVSFDSGTLFVDSVNDRVGVGITNPAYNLAVAGNANANKFWVQQAFTGSYQTMNKHYIGKQHTGSVTVPNNNAWTTVFTIGDGAQSESSMTGANYGFMEDSNAGFILVFKDWGNAYVLGLVAYTSKSYFSFNHLTIVSSYAYNSGIQISGTSIQLRHSGTSSASANFSIHNFG